MPNDESYENTPQGSDHSNDVKKEEVATVDDVSVYSQNENPSVEKTVNTPGVMILQWLTYAFWGWTLIALYWLTALAVQFQVAKGAGGYDEYALQNLGSMVAYSLAAVAVLSVISFICDALYSKFEPRRKTGAATVIMVIHAVIFALCGIGSLIVAVFAVVSTLISSGGNGATVTLITALIMSVLYGLTLVRTLKPRQVPHVRKAYWVAMLIAILVIGSLGIFGPAMYAQRTKNDRALETGLENIADAVNEYADEQGKLPESLTDSKVKNHYAVSSSDETKLVIDKNLVKYTPKEKLSPALDTKNSSSSFRDDRVVYHYQLCATFDHKKGEGSNAAKLSEIMSRKRYPTRPDVTQHNAGEICYDLQTDYSY